MTKTLKEVLLANLKAELAMAIAGGFVMRRAYIEAEIRKLENQNERRV